MIALSLRRQTVSAMCDTIQDRLKLAQRPAALEANPSDTPEYPACAIQLDRFKLDITDEDEIQGDETGPFVGARAILGYAPNIDIGGGAYLVRVGKIIGQGRIWVGCRLPAQREAMEARIMRIFFDDDQAPTRWLVTIPEPLISDYTLPFPWTVAVFMGDTEWTREYVFSERVWAWISFEMEIELLIPRDAVPMVKNFLLEFDVDVTQPVTDPDRVGDVYDRDAGADSEFYDVNPLRRVTPP